MTSYKNSPLF